jgi:ClpP class serine protease
MQRVLDPFTEKTEKDYQKLGNMADEIYLGFRQHVETYRKITDDPIEREKVFNANVFLADEAKNVG